MNQKILKTSMNDVLDKYSPLLKLNKINICIYLNLQELKKIEELFLENTNTLHRLDKIDLRKLTPNQSDQLKRENTMVKMYKKCWRP